MTTKEILLEQFTTCYDENGWFVALAGALENLSAAEAAWKTDNLDNSIREILAHLNYYNNAYLVRFKGNDFVHTIETNDDSFAGAGNVSEENWRAEIDRFGALMNEWRELLENAPESKFDAPATSKSPDSWATVIALVNTHNAYHGGQIVVIRKLQGSWDAAKGVS